jgi:hypothetical protein
LDFRLELLIITMVMASSSLCATKGPTSQRLARLAIYYGYPSLVNGASGDVEVAASTFARYDVVVFGDGIEFADRREARQPAGVGKVEHEKARQIFARIAQRNHNALLFGYVCLGDSQSLDDAEIRDRIRLWKDMGVVGIFLDEAGFDWRIVTRARQNAAIHYIHQLGLRAFPNAYDPDDLFSSDDRRGKNPGHLAPLLNKSDFFLLESFQIKNGSYEDPAEWRHRLNHALEGRKKFGSAIFATTTTADQAFKPEQFSYAWWSAWLYDLDGFGWGESAFAAVSAELPEHTCISNAAVFANLGQPSVVGSDGVRSWRRVGKSLIVIDTSTRSIQLLPPPGPGIPVMNGKVLRAASSLGCE